MMQELFAKIGTGAFAPVLSAQRTVVILLCLIPLGKGIR